MAETILIINDDPVQLELHSLWLEKAGYEVRQFRNSEEALRCLHESELPDLVITDLYMPGIDGWKVCRLLRSPEYEKCNNVPILVVSATFSGTDAEEITKGLGANAFLPAPFTDGVFLSAVKALLEGRGASQESRVLIVEDSKSLMPLLSGEFNRHNYSVVTAANGETAAELFFSFLPDVVILDYYLPTIMGDELLARFRAEKPRTVFIMMTADPDPRLAVEWMKKGASAYIRKPFNPEYLVELCSQALRERRLFHVEELLEKRTQDLWKSRNALEKSLKEKEILLKEVHHRVKNNLSMVASLLNLQLDYITDEKTAKHFLDAKGRIESMSLVHEKLYQAENLSDLDLAAYVKDILSQLVDAYCSPAVQIKTFIDVPEIPIELDTAIPLGLIVNELITNGIRHGCNEGREGVLEVALSENNEAYQLTIHDRGPGLPDNFDISTSKSLGLTLAKALSEQLDGTFKLFSDDGTAAVVTFPLG